MAELENPYKKIKPNFGDLCTRKTAMKVLNWSCYKYSEIKSYLLFKDVP
jgi:hypothetical protein